MTDTQFDANAERLAAEYPSWDLEQREYAQRHADEAEAGWILFWIACCMGVIVGWYYFTEWFFGRLG